MLSRHFALVFLFNFLIPQIGLAKDIDYLVIGVIASSDQQQGVALMKHKASGKVVAFREGETIPPKILLHKVERRFVNLLVDQKAYRMGVGDEVPQAIPNYQFQGEPNPAGSAIADLRKTVGIERQGNVLTVSGTVKNALIGENLSKVLMQAAAIPHTINGQLVGFQLLEIDEGSIFDIAGFINGDVITHINEKPINNAALAIRALNNLRQAEQVNFSYLRQNEERELTVRIN
ncbi:MAG: PDZ domain-containing protein [Oligoflexus sp.]